jgi:anti-sigma regulatory factor (Ser/Thr protein kinase)
VSGHIIGIFPDVPAAAGLPQPYIRREEVPVARRITRWGIQAMTAGMSGSGDAHALAGAASEPGCALRLVLPAAVQATGLARIATREALASWGVTHLETAVLLVSELVTNAVRHAETPAVILTLRLETAAGLLRIEVQDADPRWPQPRTPAGLDESGFGLVLVDALAGKWGVRDTPPGKSVWAELETGSAQLG